MSLSITRKNITRENLIQQIILYLFQVLHVNAKKVIDGKLTINYDVILEDIYNRGYGIIKSIEKKLII